MENDLAIFFSLPKIVLKEPFYMHRGQVWGVLFLLFFFLHTMDAISLGSQILTFILLLAY